MKMAGNYSQSTLQPGQRAKYLWVETWSRKFMQNAGHPASYIRYGLARTVLLLLCGCIGRVPEAKMLDVNRCWSDEVLE